MFDVKIAGYLLNATSGAYKISDLTSLYINYDLDEHIDTKQNEQTSLFDEVEKQKEYGFTTCTFL